MVKKVNKLIAAGRPLHLKDFLGEGGVPLPKQYLVDQISISELGEGRHYLKSSNIYSHDNMIVIGSQGSIIQTTGRCAEVKALSDKVLVLDNVPIVDAIIPYDFPY